MTATIIYVYFYWILWFYFQDESERLWFAGLIEESVHWTLETDRQTHLAKLLLKSQVQYSVYRSTVKSAYDPFGPPLRSLSEFCCMKRLEVYQLPLDCMLPYYVKFLRHVNFGILRFIYFGKLQFHKFHFT